MAEAEDLKTNNEPNQSQEFFHYYSGSSASASGAFGEVKQSSEQCAVIADPGEYLAALKSRNKNQTQDYTSSAFQPSPHLQYWAYLSPDEQVSALGRAVTPPKNFGYSSAPPPALQVPEALNNIFASAFCFREMVTKVYKTDNPIFSDLIILSQVKSVSPFELTSPIYASPAFNQPDYHTGKPTSEASIRKTLLPYRKRLLEDLYGLKIHIHTDSTGSSASVSMRKLSKWNPNNSTIEDPAAQLNTLIDIFALFQLTHSDVKPDNIMSDTACTPPQSWLVDLDNIIQQTVSGGFSCDNRFYRFRSAPSFEERIMHDKALVLSIVASQRQSNTASEEAVPPPDDSDRLSALRAITGSKKSSSRPSINCVSCGQGVLITWENANPATGDSIYVTGLQRSSYLCAVKTQTPLGALVCTNLQDTVNTACLMRGSSILAQVALDQESLQKGIVIYK